MKVMIPFASLFCATVVLAQTNFVPISNLCQSNGADVFAVSSSQMVATSFTTGDAKTFPTIYLSSVSILMGTADPGSGLGTFSLAIYNNASGSPGSNISVLSGDDFPTNAGTYTYTVTSALPLATNTTYWIVASSPDTTGGADYFWRSTPNSTLDSGSTWTLGQDKFNSGGGWTVETSSHQLFNVVLGNPQAPLISIFQPVVLTFPATTYPFVLQENSDPTTTNWVTASNAIQIRTVSSNQNVFIVPPTGQQMFYQLKLQ